MAHVSKKMSADDTKVSKKVESDVESESGSESEYALGDNNINVVFVGDDGVGKTTFLKRHMTGEFEKRYMPTSCVTKTKLWFKTNKGKVGVNVIDCPGQDKYSIVMSTHWEGAQVGIVFFDVTSRVSYLNAIVWLNELRKVMGGKFPIIVVGNKMDCIDRKVQPRQITVHRDYENVLYYDISAKSNYNYEKPFIEAIRMIHGADYSFKLD
jgi:GTP-binding nuclear protein Ran